jgi:hypothetical protein
MRSTAPEGHTEQPGCVAYAWRTGARWQQVAARAEGAPSVPAPNSEEAFVTEHYWGYTRQRDAGTVEYEVAHAPWRVWRATEPVLDADIPGLYGVAFDSALAAPPRSAFVAEGSPVTVFRPKRLAPTGALHVP